MKNESNNTEIKNERLPLLTYATTNEAKFKTMDDYLRPLGIRIKRLENVLCKVDEGEKTPILNARKKALAYYEVIKSPVFSCDSGLYFEGLPQEYQPGVNVRTVDGKRLTDEEMTDYYSSLAKRFGQLTARYQNAICLILGDNQIYDYDGEDLCGEKFIICSKPHKKRVDGFPLDCLSKSIESKKYYYDLAIAEPSAVMQKGFQDFFRRTVLKNTP